PIIKTRNTTNFLSRLTHYDMENQNTSPPESTENKNIVFNQTSHPITVTVLGDGEPRSYTITADSKQEVPYFIARPLSAGRHLKITGEGVSEMAIWIPWTFWEPWFQDSNMDDKAKMEMIDGKPYEAPCRIYFKHKPGGGHIVVGELDVGPVGDG
ncbi:MAG: hypothetical protein AAF570_08170, partial [Bacteroidota bacterium]